MTILEISVYAASNSSRNLWVAKLDPSAHALLMHRRALGSRLTDRSQHGILVVGCFSIRLDL